MQRQILMFNIILGLIMFNVIAQDVDNDSKVNDDGDDDEDFDNYKANLLNAVDTLNKNLNTNDVRDVQVQRRGWLRNLWHNVVKPVLVHAAGQVVVGALGGKRTLDANEVSKHDARALNGTECSKDAAIFKEVKKAATQLCALAKISDLKCR